MIRRDAKKEKCIHTCSRTGFTDCECHVCLTPFRCKDVRALQAVTQMAALYTILCHLQDKKCNFAVLTEKKERK
jgi:hypothetical protein